MLITSFPGLLTSQLFSPELILSFFQPFIELSVSVFHQKFLPLPLTLGPRVLECAHCAQFAVYTAFPLQMCTVHTHRQHNTHPFLLQTLPNAF